MFLQMVKHHMAQVSRPWSFDRTISAHFWPILADAPVSPFGPLATHPARTLGRNSCEKKKSHSNACLNGNTIHYLKNKDISEFSFWQEGLLWQPWLQICSCLNPKIRQGVIIFIWICRSAFVAQVAGKYIIVLSENPGKTSNCSWLKFKLSCLSLSLLKLPFGGTVYPVG